MLSKRFLPLSATWTRNNRRAINAKRAMGFLLISITGTVPISAQPTEALSGNPVLQRRCTMVVLRSETPWLPQRLIEPYLQRREDFQASRLVLTEEQGSADAVVTLKQSNERDTRIMVSNAITGHDASATSVWTDYPGMIALEVMEQLRSVCPGSIVPQPAHYPAVQECHKAVSALRLVRSLATCSHTSWMDNGKIYNAFRSGGELKDLSIQLLPACGAADAILDITHNLELTVEWNWKLRSAQRVTISSGRVIAFADRDAAVKIADEVTREIRSARGGRPRAIENDHAAQAHASVSPRTVRLLLIPSDFSVHDTRILLHVDNEQVTARDASDRLVFSFSPQEFRDVRLETEWNQPLLLDEPTSLIAQIENVGDHLWEPSWAGGDGFVINLHPAQLLAYTAGLVSYAVLGAILAQVRTPSRTLNLAWEQGGAVKTVSLQVPGHESNQLLRSLRAFGSDGSGDGCIRVAPSEVSQR